MPGSDFAQISLSLSAAAAPSPSFGVSLLLETLTSKQYAALVEQTGGSSVLVLSQEGHLATLADLGISAGSAAYQDVVAHFLGGVEQPEEAYLSYRGEPVLEHLISVVVNDDPNGPGFAVPGVYRVGGQGGPYVYMSVGYQQEVELTIVDVGGGDGDPGVYRVEDGDGNVFSYESGGFNLWTAEIVTAAAGLYTVTVDGEVYSYTATGGQTLEQIRDGLYNDMVNFVSHPAHPDWTAGKSGTTDITITGNNVGQSLTVTTNSGPDLTDDMTVTETTPIAPEAVGDIAAGITALIQAAPGYASLRWTVASALAVVTITAKAPNVGEDLEIVANGPLSGSLTIAVTTDHRNTVTEVRDGIKTLMDAATHPDWTVATGGAGELEIDGVLAGDVLEIEVFGPNPATGLSMAGASTLLLVERQSVLRKYVAQRTRIQIIPIPTTTDAWEGEYRLIVFGQTLTHVVGVGSGESVTDVRDSLQSQVDTLVAELTTAVIGTAAFDMTAAAAGEGFTTVVQSPNSNQAMTATVETAVYGIAQDITRAHADEPGWYMLVNGDHSDLDIRVAAAAIESFVPRKMHAWQTSDDGCKGTSLAAGTDIGAQLQSLARLRSFGVWHPSPVSDLVAYEAPFAAWCGDVLTDQPGQVQWHGRPLTGFTGNILTANESRNLKDREMSYLERFRALNRDAMNGNYTSAGRIIDVIRAVDQAEAQLSNNLIDLIQINRILPYTPEGIAQVVRVINETIETLAEQGSVVENSLVFVGGIPKISQATASERERGIMPEFKISFIVQAGTTQVRVTGTVSQ